MGVTLVKKIVLFRKFRERLNGISKKNKRDTDYWNNILNPYTTKPRFKRTLNSDKKQIEEYLSKVYNSKM